MSGWLETRVRWRALLDPNTGFRQRCASALTHPVTVVALAVLLLNDVLFKSLWPESWVTGKLSDLAWMVFAPPLLAFLLSFLTRGNSRTEKASWFAAYIGLPLLYAAFNTFEPVHHWILRGISIASGGTAGSPLDITDSLVIPFGMGIAVWVWRQPVVGSAALRLRWGLLVAGVAALASVATGGEPVDVHGITRLGISANGDIVANARFSSLSGYRDGPQRYQSNDGGLTWTGLSNDAGDIKWDLDLIAETPRGDYKIQGTYVSIVDAEGQSQQVYSTEYLRKPGNAWVQEQESVRQPAIDDANRPRGIVYDAASGNLIIAMGREGVVVGTPDGRWDRIAVSQNSPTDFSFAAKTRLLLSKYYFWAVVVLLSMSMTAASLIISELKGADWQAAKSAFRHFGVALGIWAMFVVFVLFLAFSYLPTIIPIGLILLVLALGAITAFAALWRSIDRKWLVLSAGVLSVASSCLLLASFGNSGADNFLYAINMGIIGVPGFIFGTVAFVFSWPKERNRAAVLAALVGMMGLTVLAFMLWLQLGIALALAKASAVVLTALVAFALLGYLKRAALHRDGDALCSNCQLPNSLLAWHCYNCGSSLTGATKTK